MQAQADSERQQKLFKAGAIAEQTAQQAGTQAKTAAQALRATQEQVRTEPVEVVIPNTQGKIGSGLLARVNFETQTQQRVVVPQTAIQKQAREDPPGTLFVVKDTEGKTKVVTRAVTLGKRADGKVEILSGLQAGERYVVRSGKPLKEGDTVSLSILSEKQ